MKKVAKKVSQESPSKFLISALVFSVLLLAFVVIFKHKLFGDDYEERNERGTSKLELVRDTKNTLKQEVKNDVKRKLNIAN